MVGILSVIAIVISILSLIISLSVAWALNEFSKALYSKSVVDIIEGKREG